MKRSLFAIATVACLLTAAQAQVTPISITGPTTLNFDAAPTLADGWSTGSVGSDHNAYGDIPGLDAAVIANTTASSVATLLPTSSSVPPTTSALARYNTALHCLQSRPTTTAYTMLMATLHNNTGAAVNSLDLSFVLRVTIQSGATTAIDEIPGWEAFYSFTGAAGTWVKIDGLSGANLSSIDTDQVKSATLDFSGNQWAPDTDLYILFADDNGTASGTNPNVEPGYTMDNFAITPAVGPRELTVNPLPIPTVTQCDNYTWTAVAFGGDPPYTYAWYITSDPDNPLGTGVSFTLTNIQPAMSNNSYYVMVTDNSGHFTWAITTILVNEVSAPPAIVSAVSSTNRTTITVHFSEKVNLSSATGGDFIVHPTNGSPDIALTSAVVANGTNVTLTAASQLDRVNYLLRVVGSGITGCAGSVANGSSVPLAQQIILVDIPGTSWQYNQAGINLDTSGWLANDYNDQDTAAGWETGNSLLDGKSTGRTTLGGYTVETTLSLHNSGDYATADIPTYYFKHHFNVNLQPANVTLAIRCMFDDFGIVYLNGQEGYRDTQVTTANEIFDQYLGTSVGDASLSAVRTWDNATAPLLAGANVLAVKLKQQSAGSSDITMGLQVIATVTDFTPPEGGELLVDISPSGNRTVNQCANVSWTSSISGGYQPYTYQWYKNGSPLSGQTSATLTLNNVPANGGATDNYVLRVTDSHSTETYSAASGLTVTPAVAPALVSASSAVDRQTITVSFNTPVQLSSAVGADFLVHLAGGSTSVPLTSSTTSTNNANDIILVTATALQNTNYVVQIQGSGVTACAGAVPNGTSVPLVQEILVIAVTNTPWQYNDKGVDLGTGWLPNSYNDHGEGWQSGTSIFDTRYGTNRINVVAGFPVSTLLLWTNATFHYSITDGTNVIPTYYYRTHFTMNLRPANVTFQLRTFFDDYGIVYLNGQEGYADAPFTNAANRAFLAYTGSATDATALSAIRPFPTTNLLAGDNVLAVYVKQASAGSSDSTMGLQLIALVSDFSPPVDRPRITYTKGAGTMTISWTPAGGVLQQSTTLLPGSWTDSGVANGGTVSATPGYKFYRVQQ